MVELFKKRETAKILINIKDTCSKQVKSDDSLRIALC